MLELVGGEAETFGTAELVEQRLRVIGAVVVADPAASRPMMKCEQP